MTSRGLTCRVRYSIGICSHHSCDKTPKFSTNHQRWSNVLLAERLAALRPLLVPPLVLVSAYCHANRLAEWLDTWCINSLWPPPELIIFCHVWCSTEFLLFPTSTGPHKQGPCSTLRCTHITWTNCKVTLCALLNHRSKYYDILLYELWNRTSSPALHKNAKPPVAWWRHQMETFSALLAICAGNSLVPMNSQHKGQWRGALMFSLICVWINGWANNRKAGDLRRHRARYDVIVMGHRLPHIKTLQWRHMSVMASQFIAL